MFDMVIRGGQIVDGTGAPARPGDLGIVGNRIVALGSVPPGAEAAATVDATDHVVAPGFIDIHSHSDCSLFLNRRAESAVRQGVTTELLGNCGMGCAPLADPAHLPMVSIGYLPQIDVTWRTFGQWLDALGSGGLAHNVASLVGHGAVRLAAMGPASRAADSDEIRQMVRLVEASMEEGAFGVSSGLEYSPGKLAAQPELAALAEVAGRHDGLYATHIRDRDYHYAEAIQEAISTAASANVALQISHVSPRWGSPPGAGEAALDRIDAAYRQGVDVWFDNHPFTFGRGLVMSTLPPEAFAGGLEGFRQRLQDPDQRRAMRGYDNPQWKHRLENRWDLLLIFDAPHHRDWEGLTILQIAEQTGQDPWDVVCDLLLGEWENPTALFWSAPIHRQEDVDATFRHPRGLIMSDGADVATDGPYAHVRDIYAYGWVANVLRRYVRERALMTMEEAVHKMSGLPARRLGLTDRGTLEVGQRADIVVFQPEKVQDRTSLKHPVAYAGGICNVWVNGVLTVKDGEHTGALPGSVLRS